MSRIHNMIAREILDSRGFPTVEVEVLTEDGSLARASVPSGASTGEFECYELRDEDPKRYKAKGVLTACEHVSTEILPRLKGLDCTKQSLIDKTLIKLDGTANKSRLGANALLAVSLACAKAAAESTAQPLYRYLGGAHTSLMPIPLINILNGGEHAPNQLDIQEFMIVPHKATSFREALRMGTEVFHSLKFLLKKAGHITSVGDEGGFAPSLSTATEALDFIQAAIKEAGYLPGEEISLALDVAASEFFKKDKYELQGLKKTFTQTQMIHYLSDLCDKYPIVSIEDGLDEHDWEGFTKLTEKLGDKVQIVGDDLFVTSSKRLEEGAKKKAANAILIKPNQVGTLSETIECIHRAQRLGYKTIVSHRSGETEDTSIADLAVATGAGQIKTGSVSRSDRTAKYNQLLRIEEELGAMAEYVTTVF